MSGKRPGKTKAHITPPGDFIALGKQSKSGSLGSDSQSTSKKLVSLVTGDKKREAATTPVIPGLPAKKPKLSTQTFTPLGRPNEPERRASPAPVISQQYEECAIEVDGSMLYDEILEAEESGDDERLEGLFCGAVKYLHSNRSKPDPSVYLAVMYFAKARSSMFSSEIVIQAFCSLLKRDMSLNFKSKGNCLVSVFACNALMSAFHEEENWPDDFVKVYIDDSLGERVWVDRADCKGFVDNILTAFNTNLPAKGSLPSTETTTPSGQASPTPISMEDEDKSESSVEEKFSSALGDIENINIFPRYPYQQDNIESYTLDIIKDQLNRRQQMDNTSRNLIRLMTATCGYGEVRHLAAHRLELWLQNPKLTRPAQDLLMSVCMNCNQHDQMDLDVIGTLIKMRMKTKPLLNHFLLCLRELLSQHPENCRMILNHTVYNELSNSRNPNNMSVIGVIFQSNAEQAAKILAEIFQDLLANKDDYLRAVRALLREIVRFLRHDMKFTTFCLCLLHERVEPKFVDMEQSFKERYIISIADLVTLTIFIMVSPTVREATMALSKGDKSEIETLHNYREQVAIIQRDAVWWLHSIVPKFMEVKPGEYIHCLHKVLFMENMEHYYNKDNWPSETDRSTLLRLAAEVPVLEDTLMRLLVIGLSTNLPLNPADAVELVDRLIKRAASLSLDGQSVLNVERLELVDAVFNLCAYRYPTDISLPKGYRPPTLAISNLYWKAWVILLILAAFNPQSFGYTAWKDYPTLKCLMEIVMTRNYKFPPPTMATEDKMVEEVKNRENQVADQEKQQILEFESHLAAATSKVTITEANSLLISQLTSMDPNGIARNPPVSVLEQLKTLNDSLHIGEMLCKSRHPDFLLDIIQRQGTSQSMPWLAELVEGSEGSLEVLPVQCLCEFLIYDTADVPSLDEESKHFDKHKKKQKLKKKEQLLLRLQSLVHSDSADNKMASQVLDYFLKRLASTQAVSRSYATKGLSMVVSRSQFKEEDQVIEPNSWLLNDLPSLAVFSQVKVQIFEALRQACLIETDPLLVSSYIIFLSEQTMEQTQHELDDLAIDVAQLIVERTTVINHILPWENEESSVLSHKTLTALIDLYYNYLKKAKEPDKEAYSWSNTQDQIILQWECGDSATMHVLVVHAMIILLTYGAPNRESHYEELLVTWFPEKGSPPSAFLLDTSEEALLLPDWLKLRMIRSHVKRLVNVALQDTEPGQLLLFVQSFGIPVASMSQLLCCLDQAVDNDPVILEEGIEDKMYMSQLIEIQHMRGAKGGDKLYKLLTKNIPPEVKAMEDVEMKEDSGFIDGKWKLDSQTVSPKPDTYQQISDVLRKMFTHDQLKDSNTEKEYQKILMGVSSNNQEIINILSRVLLELLAGPEGTMFAKGLCVSTKACPLIKQLICKKDLIGEPFNRLMEVLSGIAKIVKNQKSPLASIINLFFTDNARKKNVAETSRRFIERSLAKDKESKCLNVKDILDEVGEDSDILERIVKDCMKTCMSSNKRQSTNYLMSDVLQMHGQSQRCKMSESMAILLVDWLEILQPEIVNFTQEVDQQLLFAKDLLHGTEVKMESDSRPYLLALLTHQSSWKTLNSCVNCLLRREVLSSYNPSLVLDFLWACTHIPKIWQGREKTVPKNQLPDNVLGLSMEQLVTMVMYIVEEASMYPITVESADNTTVVPALECIRNRIDLFTHSLCGSESGLKYVVNYVQKCASVDHKHKTLYQYLLVELYCHCPKMSSWLPNLHSNINEMKMSPKTIAQIDVVSHRLLSTLLQAGHGKRNEDKMYDSNLACRKLASQHPLLMLRQLPLIAAQLKGKSQFSFGEMRHKNYIHLFVHILGLLEALQPHIFRKEYKALEDVLECYFSLLSAHSQEKQLAPIIVKFVKFLHQFVASRPQQSVVFLQKHVELLSHVSSLYKDLQILNSLLAGLTLPRQTHEEDTHIQGDVTETTPLRSSSPWPINQLAPYLKRIKGATDIDDVMDVLHELDEVSRRKVDIIQHFLSDLKRLVVDLSDRIRNTAYSLIMRYIRQNPREAKHFVGSLLQSLDSESPDVVNSALKNLPEFCVLCQDHADVILQKAFLVGITSSLETGSFISETLQLLNMESTES